MSRKLVGKLRRMCHWAGRQLDERHLVDSLLATPSLLERFVHFWVLVGRTYLHNHCAQRAAALSYATLLALIPLLAILISVSGSLLKRHGEDALMGLVDQVVQAVTPGVHSDGDGNGNKPEPTAPTGGGMANNPAEGGDAGETRPDSAVGEGGSDQITVSREEVAARIREFIGNIQTGSLGIGGVIALLVLAIGLINRVEETLNDLWGVTRGRSLHLRLAYYSAVLLLGPILLAATVTLTSADQVQAVREFFKQHLPLGALLDKTATSLMPYVVLSIGFTLLYVALPNTRVKWRAAALGGVLAGCLWQINSEMSVVYTSRVITYSRIYGAFAMVPLLMLAMYLHWMILLFGAQVSYVAQNGRTYLEDLLAHWVNQRSRERLAFRVMVNAGRAFQFGSAPPRVATLAEEAEVPVRLVEQVVEVLLKARLLHEVNGGDPTFVPARPLDTIHARDILHALRDDDGDTFSGRPIAGVDDELAALQAAEDAAAARVTLEALVSEEKDSGPVDREGPTRPLPIL
ncbi:MAG: YihY family inner membrane protein [Verrucomicrobiales bacterium]|nr:YihY family inner membrane protein [Verrucomicrobiales bacterium]